jgi:hypothetical protein
MMVLMVMVMMQQRRIDLMGRQYHCVMLVLGVKPAHIHSRLN